MSYISRLKKKMKEKGIEGLIRKSRLSSKKIPEAKAKVIAGLYEDLYCDFNILHFKDKLEENHKIKLSYPFVRNILIDYSLHHPKKKKKVYRRRRRGCPRLDYWYRWIHHHINGLNISL